MGVRKSLSGDWMAKHQEQMLLQSSLGYKETEKQRWGWRRGESRFSCMRSLQKDDLSVILIIAKARSLHEWGDTISQISG